jgi:hypothetical protein
MSLARCAGIAALLAIYADAPAEEKFGRLFFSADERRVLDDLRDEPPQPVGPKKDPNDKTAVAPVVDVISFDGKVERSGGGGTTIWVPSDAGRTDFSLKVGQKIAVQSGKVLDSYEARAAEDAESVFAVEKPSAPDPAAGSDDAPQEGPGPSPGAPKPPATN